MGSILSFKIPISLVKLTSAFKFYNIGPWEIGPRIATPTNILLLSEHFDIF